MKTSSIQELNGAATRSLTDEKMDQVRELLFGEFEQQTEVRVKELEARVRELEVGLHRRLDAMQARMEALSGELDSNQRTVNQELADGLQDVAERLRRAGAS